MSLTLAGVDSIGAVAVVPVMRRSRAALAEDVTVAGLRLRDHRWPAVVDRVDDLSCVDAVPLYVVVPQLDLVGVNPDAELDAEA